MDSQFAINEIRNPFKPSLRTTIPKWTNCSVEWIDQKIRVHAANCQ